MKVMYGEEAGSNTSIRAVGTIESLLLMTEWHPRALHFAPDVDGWDRDTMEQELGGSNGYIHGRRGRETLTALLTNMIH